MTMGIQLIDAAHALVEGPAAAGRTQATMMVEAAAADGVGGVGGVVVAAAVALLLADAIGDAPVNVAGVGGASRYINIIRAGLL
jgi:hypothetical protein